MTATKTEKVAKKSVKKAAKKAAKAVAERPPSYEGPKGELAPPELMSRSLPEGQIVISRINTETIRIPIIGIAPLMTNKFSNKAKQQMRDAMQNRKSPREPKNPEQEYHDAAYYLDDGERGMQAIAFKKCTVSAARYFPKNVTMVGLKQALFMEGEFSKKEGLMLVRIIGTPEMREDVVRVGNGGADLRYRPYWYEWSASIDVTYVKSMLTRDSVLSLVEAGGLGVGVGEYRPEKGGDCGTFKIDESRQVEIIR